jgi:thymidylate kinase
LLIECFGLPGTGKSTLSRRIAEILVAQGVSVDEITYDLDHRRGARSRISAKAAYVAHFIASHPGRAMAYTSAVTATRQRTLRDFRISLFNWLFIASLSARKDGSGKITLLDQGFAQAMWSVGFAAGVETWLDVLPVHRNTQAFATDAPDVVVYVQAGFAEIARRLASRSQRVSRLEEQLMRDEYSLERADAQAQAVLRRLETGGAHILRLANDSPEQLACNAEIVAASVITMVKRGALRQAGSSPQQVPCGASVHPCA